jgi:hypothetical protein
MMWRNTLLSSLWAQGISLHAGPNATAQIQAFTEELRAGRVKRTLEDSQALSSLLFDAPVKDEGGAHQMESVKPMLLAQSLDHGFWDLA